MPTQGDKIRILDVPQFQALMRRMDGIGEALHKVGEQLEILNLQLAKTQEELNGPAQQE